MSSLAASRADNFYHPPEWDPQKVGRDRYQGSSGSNQWEKYGTMRFEMPYNIWRGGCKKHIRKGTRFNAKKLDAGKYFSTKIFEFHMKCACCPQKIVVRTDPKNRDYEVASGGRRKIEPYDEESVGVERLSTQDERAKISADPFYKLEHAGRDSRTVREAQPRLARLLDLRDDQRKDDFGSSQALRRQHRERKKQASAAAAAAQAAAQAASAAPLIPLLPDSGEDRRRASLVVFKRKTPSGFEQSRIKKRTSLAAGSIFGSSATGMGNPKAVAALAKVRARGVDVGLFRSAPAASAKRGSMSHVRVIAKRQR